MSKVKSEERIMHVIAFCMGGCDWSRESFGSGVSAIERKAKYHVSRTGHQVRMQTKLGAQFWREDEDETEDQ